MNYTGRESVAESMPASDSKAATLRQQLEAGCHCNVEASLVLVLGSLAHEGGFIRFAARTQREFRPVEQWESHALAHKDPSPLVQGYVALARLKKPTKETFLFRRLEELAWGK